MTITIFSLQAGKVAVLRDPAVPAVAAVRLSDFGGFETFRSVITRVAFSGQVNVQFRHMIGGTVNLYSFGDRVGSAVVAGLCFDEDCSGAGNSGLSHVTKYFDDNRVSNRGTPVRLTLGATISLPLYLLGISAEIVDPKSRVSQFQLQLALVPRPRRRAVKNAAAGGGEAAAAGEEEAAAGTGTQLPAVTNDYVPNYDKGGASAGNYLVPMPGGDGFSSHGTGPAVQLAGFTV